MTTVCEHSCCCRRPAKWRVDAIVNIDGLRGIVTYYVCGMHLHRHMAARAAQRPGVTFAVAPVREDPDAE